MTVPADVHDAFDLVEEQFNEALDSSLDPAGPGMLYEYVAAMGLAAGATAVDAGCGEGEHALELSRRFGLQVTGVDPVARCVEAARLAARPGGTVTFETGTVQDLPAASASVDLVRCRDVLCLVEDLGRGAPRIPPRAQAGRPGGDLPDIRDQPARAGRGRLPPPGHGLLPGVHAPGEHRGRDRRRRIARRPLRGAEHAVGRACAGARSAPRPATCRTPPA